MKKLKVAILYKSLPQYRRRFFELLEEKLREAGIELILIYGQPGPEEASKQDSVDLPWAWRIENRIFSLGGKELYWQPCLHLLKGADLVIVEQASKLLINYLLLLLSRLGRTKVALWGHGKNFQAHRASLFGEKIKRKISRHAHWWFAYTEGVRKVVSDLGFPPERITVVQNAIDTLDLVNFKEELDPMALSRLRGDLGLEGNNVCLYIGGMYPEKRIDFLLKAASLVKERIPDFELLFIGSGPDSHLAEEAALSNSWIRCLGPKFEHEKASYFMLSKLLLMPGLVGLAVLDSFALEVPMVTTAVPFHSPEIEYLKDGFNGTIVRDAYNPEAYARAVIDLLNDEALYRQLKQGCRETAPLYTVKEMVDRFAQGVLDALEK